MANSYTLRISIAIEEKDDRGAFTGGRLCINEEQKLDVTSFMEIASVLGRFHDVGEALRREGSRKDSAETGS